ncbi:MAG: PQQ-binding-like beta-propeller repeat protein [Planctomycetota bacterium]
MKTNASARSAAFALAMGSLVGPWAAAADWPGFLGPQRNGKSAETGLLQAWPEAGPPLVWQCPLGTGYTAPAVASGKLVEYGRFGDATRLTCRDARTGDELWRSEHPTAYTDMLGYNDGPRCSPVIDGNRVYTHGAEGLLRCVGLADGEEVWRLDTSRRFHVVKNFFGVGSTPVVWQGLLIVNVGGSPPGGPSDVYAARGNVQGAGSGVVAFDKLTGKVRWQTTDELASYASPVVVEQGGRPWCFVFARGGLVSLNPSSGEVDFQLPYRSAKLESVNASTPVAAVNRLFLSETYEVGGATLEFGPGGHKLLWADRQRRRDKAMQLHWNTPILHEGYLYGSSGRHSGSAELRCVDFQTGEVKWSEPGLARASLLYADGRLVCLTEDGILRLLRPSPDKYDPVSEHRPVDDRGRRLLRGDAWVAPVLSAGLLYVRGEDRLVCYDVRQR